MARVDRDRLRDALLKMLRLAHFPLPDRENVVEQELQRKADKLPSEDGASDPRNSGSDGHKA